MDDSEDELIEVSDRLVSPAEMADVMGVAEADVLGWIAAGRVQGEFVEDGTLRVRISEHMHESGPAGPGVIFYQASDDPRFMQEWERCRAARDRAERPRGSTG